MKLETFIHRFFGKTMRELSHVFVVQFLFVFLSFIISIIIARAFGKENFGAFSFFFSLVMILSIISVFGCQNGIPKLIAKNKRLAHVLIIKSFKLAMPVTLLTLVVYTILSSFVNINPPVPFFNFFVVVYIIFIIPFMIFTNALRGAKMFVLSTAYSLYARIIFLCLILGIIFLKLEFRYVLLALGLSVIPLLPHMIHKVNKTFVKTKKRFSNVTFLKVNLTFLLVTVSLFFLYHIDRIMVGYFLAFDRLGEYSAYSTITNIIRLIASSIPLVVVPLAVKTKYKIKRSLIKLIGLLVPFSIAVFIFSIVAVPIFFGEDFVVGVSLPASLVISATLLVIYAYLNSIFIGESELSRLQTTIVGADFALSIILSIMLSILLIPRIGFIGAPIAIAITLLAKIFLNIKGLYMLRHNKA